MDKIRVDQSGCWFGIWLIGWMFTIGFFHLPFWRAALAIIIWPYHLGTFVSNLVK